MNLIILFCIPLVVTGQRTGGRMPIKENDENEPIKMIELEGPETSETEMYSKFEYGSHVGYKNSPVDEFVVGQHGEYFRRPSGVVGQHNVNIAGINSDDHPSLVASNIYNSIRDKKFKGGNRQQTPSPLEHGPPASVIATQQRPAALATYHDQHLQTVDGPVPSHLGPDVQHASVVPLTSYQPFLLQDPQTGQLVQSPVYQSESVPLYKSHVAPYVTNTGFAAHQIPLAQKVVPSINSYNVPQYHQQLIGKTIAHSDQQVLLKAAPAPVYPTHLLKSGVVPLYHQSHLLQPTIEPLYAPHLFKTHTAQPQLLKLASPEVYRTHLFKTSGALVSQVPVLKTAGDTPLTAPLLKSGAFSPNYPFLVNTVPHPLHYPEPVLVKSPHNNIYGEAPYLKAAPTPIISNVPVTVNQFYQTPVALKNSPLFPTTVLKDASSHAILNGHPTILKSYPKVEATIVPAVEEHVTGIHQTVPAVPLTANIYATHASYDEGLAPNPVILKSKHPKIFLQKPLLHKPPVYAEKAVLKAALSPIYGNHALGFQKAIIKAPIAAHFSQKGYLEPDLPAKILTSQKALVDSIIFSDAGKIRGKAPGLSIHASHIELVPSLSYGYSYSLYPKSNGLYSSSIESHHHHHQHHHH